MYKDIPEVTLLVRAYVTNDGIGRIIGPECRHKSGNHDGITQTGGDKCLGTYQISGEFIPPFLDGAHNGEAAVKKWLQTRKIEGFNVVKLSD